MNPAKCFSEYTVLAQNLLIVRGEFEQPRRLGGHFPPAGRACQEIIRNISGENWLMLLGSLQQQNSSLLFVVF
jgi:hypothetical protein